MKAMNLRTLVVGPDKGKDVNQTQILTGEASPDSASKATNETTQHTTNQGKGPGPWGGEDSKS
jgi:hypothetical protein